MKKVSASLLLAAALFYPPTAHAQADLGTIVTGIAESLISQETDRRAFANAQRLNTVSAYRDYLRNYPTGVFRVDAEKALAKLGAPTKPVDPVPDGGKSSPAAIEASLGLGRESRKTIQKQLTSLGYSTGVADGLWGNNTRQAIAKWQTANKLTANGYFTAPQISLISRQAGVQVPPAPESTYGADDPVEERLLYLTYNERREVQRMLTRLGYNTRGVDGAFGGNTRRALAAWQRDEGLRASGYLTADQLRALRRDTGF